MSFTTTTQDTWSHNTTDAVVSEPGTALISGRLLVGIARSLPAQPVSFALQTSGRVEVTCGASSFCCRPCPATVPAAARAAHAVGSVDAAMFASAVAQVAVASASPDDRNPRLRRYPDGDRTGRASDPGRHRPLPLGRTRAGVEPAGDRRSAGDDRARSGTTRSDEAFADASEVSAPSVTQRPRFH